MAIGHVFLGKYRVDSILGHGGMGVVAECTHLALNERVAIKMLRQDVLSDQDAVQRFIREAQAAVKLKSEYVARVSDVGTFENGVPYMVMEFLEGHDLGQLLEQRGVLPVAWATELMLQTAEALAEAHSLGIVHRDVKPTNLFVTWRPDGSSLVKVLDFGISKSPLGTDMQLTQTQSLLCTPAYMSPEQMRSARLVDTRTDIWSLGTVFYEVLEGRRPFEAESFSEMCVKVAVDPPSPMVNTPPALQQVILRCLAKNPEQRYSNMAELGRDLVPFAQDPHQATVLVERMARMLRRSHIDFSSDTGAGIPKTPVRDLPSAPVSAWSIGSEPAGKPYRADGSAPFSRVDIMPGSGPVPLTTVRTRKRRWPLILIGFLLAAGAGGAIAFTQSGGDTEKTVPAPTTETPMVEAPAPTPPVPTPPPPTQPATAQTGSDTAAPPEVKTEPETKPPSVAEKAHAKRPPIVKASVTRVVPKKDEPKPTTTAKEPPATTTPEVKAPEQAPCDPLRHPHDCNH